MSKFENHHYRWPETYFVLFDVHKDPLESEPLQASEQLATLLTERRADLSARAHPSSQQQPIDDATREKLRALGYQH